VNSYPTPECDYQIRAPQGTTQICTED